MKTKRPRLEDRPSSASYPAYQEKKGGKDSICTVMGTEEDMPY
jgi:hypothetical protein